MFSNNRENRLRSLDCAKQSAPAPGCESRPFNLFHNGSRAAQFKPLQILDDGRAVNPNQLAKCFDCSEEGRPPLLRAQKPPQNGVHDVLPSRDWKRVLKESISHPILVGQCDAMLPGKLRENVANRCEQKLCTQVCAQTNDFGKHIVKRIAIRAKTKPKLPQKAIRLSNS